MQKTGLMRFVKVDPHFKLARYTLPLGQTKILLVYSSGIPSDWSANRKKSHLYYVNCYLKHYLLTYLRFYDVLKNISLKRLRIIVRVYSWNYIWWIRNVIHITVVRWGQKGTHTNGNHRFPNGTWKTVWHKAATKSREVILSMKGDRCLSFGFRF